MSDDDAAELRDWLGPDGYIEMVAADGVVFQLVSQVRRDSGHLEVPLSDISLFERLVSIIPARAMRLRADDSL